MDRETWLFDLDGTLIDSASAHAAAFDSALASFGRSDMSFRYEEHAGRDTVEVFGRLGFGRGDAELLAARKRQSYRSLVADGRVRLVPGAEILLHRLNERGSKCFVVSSGHRVSVRAALERTSLGGLIIDVLSGDAVLANKPAPDLYLEACRRWKLRPANVVAVEDSHAGRESARAAGLDVIAVSVDGAGTDDLTVYQLAAALEGAFDAQE